MAPGRRKGAKKSTAATSVTCRHWNVGDLVLAKVKGFPAWPATLVLWCYDLVHMDIGLI
ncbi:HUA2-like protein 3 [Trifolium medium]|uniref:HUA2-like protein 3 n=1 Tax=Trifolium medium TaxID=97028 RepID=A0A392QUU9_9FABA|nr:HUA2-like protein 3 [Trifolium medium]